MATKEISQLPSTNVSNDTDLLMTRQGSQDRAVQVEKVRNIGTSPGQTLGVGSFGLGGDAISITSIYASNNANLIDQTGVYAVNGTTNTPVAQGELIHTQLSSNSATQQVIGENQEAYWRKKVSGTWLAWVLDSAANKATVRTDLDVYSTSEVYSTTQADSTFLNDANGVVSYSNLNVTTTTTSNVAILPSSHVRLEPGPYTVLGTRLTVKDSGGVIDKADSYIAQYINFFRVTGGSSHYLVYNGGPDTVEVRLSIDHFV